MLSRIIATVAVLVPLFYVFCLNHVPVAHVGVAYDWVNGTVRTQSIGMHVTPPWVLATSIDERPHRVCLNASTRVLACKLVQFNPDGLQQFIEWHGFSYWNDEIDCAPGNDCSSNTLFGLLRAYAFSGQELPKFVRVIGDTRSQ